MKKRSKMMPMLVGAGAVAIGALVMAQTPKGGPTAAVKTGRVDRSSEAPVVDLLAVGQARKPLAFYVSSVRGDLFSHGVPVPPAAPVAPPTVAMPEPPSMPAPIDPFVDYAYTGTVSTGDTKMALVENSKTKEGQYLKVGDSFLGGSITAIADRSVTVNVAGVARTMAKNEDFSLTPLNKSAAYLTAAPPAAPGGPQAGGPGGATMGMPGGMQIPGINMEGMPQAIRDRIQQRMNSMSPQEREQAAARMMNRRFEGGGGRGGGGGFGGGGRDGGGGGRDRG